MRQPEEEATEVTTDLEKNTVDGLKRALTNELQPLRSRSIGTIKLYLQLENSSDRVKLDPSWSVRPGPGTVHPLAEHKLIKGKPFADHYAGGLPNNARIVVVLPAPSTPVDAADQQQQLQIALQRLNLEDTDIAVRTAELLRMWSPHQLRPMDAVEDVKDDASYLQFPKGFEFAEFRCDNLFVRRCYKDLYDALWDKTAKQKRRSVIVGTPGIGKSTFILYLIWRLFQTYNGSDGKPMTDMRRLGFNHIVYSTSESDLAYAFDLSGKCLIVGADSLKGAIYAFDSETALHIVDSREPIRFAEKKPYTLLVTSPNAALVALWNKCEHTKLYMPALTFDEIQICQSVSYPTLDWNGCQHRYNVWGGSLRFVLALPGEVKQRGALHAFLGKLADTSLDKLLSLAETMEELSDVNSGGISFSDSSSASMRKQVIHR